MVLRSMPKPAWLSSDAPHGDVVLSSRTRVMRNLFGFRFVHRAETDELMRAMDTVITAAEMTGVPFETFKGLTNAERDYLVGCRLVSPDFPWTEPGRALMIDQTRSLSLMVNEEDHIRLQAVTAGWSITNSNELAYSSLSRLKQHLDFAFSPDYGYLSSSPFNLGYGRRQSAMFHLIGLAHTHRLPDVMKALIAKGIAVRGLFGESSRAIGAYVQVSVIGRSREEFAGACEYLLKEERGARQEVTRPILTERAKVAWDLAASSRSISLADALRILAWFRWAASAETPGFNITPRQIDDILTELEIRNTQEEATAAARRADLMRSALGI